jgi:hypothetical protein
MTLFNVSSSASDDAVRTAVEKEIQKQGGIVAIDIKIKYRSNHLTYFLDCITAGIWAPSTATISRTSIRGTDFSSWIF